MSTRTYVYYCSGHGEFTIRQKTVEMTINQVMGTPLEYLLLPATFSACLWNDARLFISSHLLRNAYSPTVSP